MPNGSMQLAIDLAMAYCWDELHGYSPLVGAVDPTHMGYPDFDCSGLVGRCLNEAGFNYPGYPNHIGTMNMDDNPMSSINSLGTAGFTLNHVTDLNNIQIESGDIVVLNSYNTDWSNNGGHTFFYYEGAPLAYVTTIISPDSVSYPPLIGFGDKVKIEASSTRPWHVPGIDAPNPLGACTEVWVHKFANLVSNYYDPQDPNHYNYVTVAHCPWSDVGNAGAMAALLTCILRKHRRRNW